MIHELNTQLFLRINRLLGKRVWLDRCMFFFGQWLIVVLVALVCVWALSQANPFSVIAWVLSALLFSLLMSQYMGFIHNQPRPESSVGGIITLIAPLGQWKSFPSDHTIIVTTLVWAAWVFAAPLWLVIVLGIGGVLVAFSRVYCGVHYPFDVLGGIGVGALGAWSATLLLF